MQPGHLWYGMVEILHFTSKYVKLNLVVSPNNHVMISDLFATLYCD